MADTNEVTFVIEGKGKKEDDKSLTGITFTKIKIGDEERTIEDTDDDHTKAKEALSELLSKNVVVGGGSSHKRKSYKKEKKIKGGKRKSMRRNKHV